jgi:Glycosyltransferase family 87
MPPEPDLGRGRPVSSPTDTLASEMISSSPAPRTPRNGAKALTHLAVGLWAALIVVVCARSAWQPGSRSLYPTFAAAGAHWRAGSSLYQWPPAEPDVDAYRYSPIVAVSLVPFSLLPPGAGSVLWRLVNAGVLLSGLAAWLSSPLPWSLDTRQRALLYLLVLPLAATSLNNGQTNPLVIGFLLLTIAAAGAEKWNLAAVSVALATALKIYPLTMGLLLAAAYPRRFAGRLVVALLAVAALAFLFQRPDYVAAQYADWLRLVGDDDRKSWPLHMAYRDLWLLFRVTGTPLTPRGYQLIQAVSGIACAAVCVAGRLCNWPQTKVLTAVFTLGTCWMILCGPATESSTYVLLAPALAAGMLAARVEAWPRPLCWLPDAAAALLLIGLLAGVSRWTTPIQSLGVQPLAALLLFAAYLAVNVGQLRSGARDAGTIAGRPAARAA